MWTEFLGTSANSIGLDIPRDGSQKPQDADLQHSQSLRRKSVPWLGVTFWASTSQYAYGKMTSERRAGVQGF